jgi:hypothetical protein
MQVEAEPYNPNTHRNQRESPEQCDLEIKAQSRLVGKEIEQQAALRSRKMLATTSSEAETTPPSQNNEHSSRR